MTTPSAIAETTIEVDGVRYNVALLPDDETDCVEAECSPEATAAYERGDWRFVAIWIRPVVNGVEITYAGDSLYGCAFGRNPDCVSDTEPDGTMDLDALIGVCSLQVAREVRANLRRLGVTVPGAELADCTAENPADDDQEPKTTARLCQRAGGHGSLHIDALLRAF